MEEESVTPSSIDYIDENGDRNDSAYKSRKPRWWYSLSGRPTKSQRKAITSMESYRISKPAPDCQGKPVCIDWNEVFGNETSNSYIGLELGFGNGENLLTLAAQKNALWVGAEVHKAGIGRLCRRMQEGIDKSCWWTGGIRYRDGIKSELLESNTDDSLSPDVDNDAWTPANDNVKPYNNLRFHIGDGVKFLSCIPSNSLDCITLTFPDPFPSDHQSHWRVIQVDTVCEIYRILKPETGLFYLATDHPVYDKWCKSVIDTVNNNDASMSIKLDPVEPCPDRATWLPIVSKYELKGWKEGRETMLSCWRKC